MDDLFAAVRDHPRCSSLLTTGSTTSLSRSRSVVSWRPLYNRLSDLTEGARFEIVHDVAHEPWISDRDHVRVVAIRIPVVVRAARGRSFRS